MVGFGPTLTTFEEADQILTRSKTVLDADSDFGGLDLTRISDRIIVTGRCWAHRTDRLANRNNAAALAAWLNMRYPKRYLICNLSSPESSYDPLPFNSQILSFPVPRSQVPSLRVLIHACRSIVAFLSLSPKNVIVIQCRNGKSRTGLLTACLLRYCGVFESTSDALDYFYSLRCPLTLDCDQSRDSPPSVRKTFLKLPSPLALKDFKVPNTDTTQKRYMRYFDDVLIMQGAVPNKKPLELRQVLMNTVPNFDGEGGCHPGIEIFENGRLLYTSRLATNLANRNFKVPNIDSKYFDADRDQLSDDIPLEDCVSDIIVTDIDVGADGKSPLVLVDTNHIMFHFNNLKLHEDIVIRIFHHNIETGHNTTILYVSFNTGFVSPGLIRLRPVDLQIPVPFSMQNSPANSPPIFFSSFSIDSSQPATQNLSGIDTRFSPEFSLDLVVSSAVIEKSTENSFKRNGSLSSVLRSHSNTFIMSDKHSKENQISAHELQLDNSMPAETTTSGLKTNPNPTKLLHEDRSSCDYIESFVSYNETLMPSRAKDLFNLSRYHILLPEPLLVKALEMQGYRKFFVRIALQLLNNDIHSSHEFLSALVNDRGYADLERDLVYLGRSKYVQMMRRGSFSHYPDETGLGEDEANDECSPIVIGDPFLADQIRKLSAPSDHISSTFSYNKENSNDSDSFKSVEELADDQLDENKLSDKVTESANYDYKPELQNRENLTTTFTNAKLHDNADELLLNNQKLITSVQPNELNFTESKTANVYSSLKSQLDHNSDDRSGKTPSLNFLQHERISSKQSFPEKNDSDAISGEKVENNKTVGEQDPKVLNFNVPSPPPLPPIKNHAKVPPPPPPMPKGKKILPNATRESPIINVDRPMVKNKLHWEELRIPRNLSGSIWDTSTSALPREKNIFEIINRHHFEELFCVEKATLASSLSVVSMNSSEDLVSPEKSKNKGKSSGFRKQTPAKIYVLGLRRVNNVGISLARFYKRLSDDEIIDSIVLRRVNLMSLDDLLALKSAIPTAEERSSLLAFQGSKDSLGAVESFLLQAAREPDLDWMLEALIFERQFDSDVEVLAGKLTRIIDALNLIRNSESLQILLHAVLQLGNLVNYEYGRAGTSRAQASAFRLESLLRLQEVKSADNKTTLLTYLVTCLEDRHPDLLSLPVDFSTLSVVRNWDSQALLLQVGEIATQFLRIRDPKIKQKHGANETSSTSAGRLSDFTEAQRTFLDRAAASLERLGSLAEEMRTALSKTLQYFGEPPKELTLKNGASLSAHTESGDTRLAESMFTVLDEFFKALSETTTSIRKTRTIKSKVLSGSLSNSSSKESVSNIPSDESSQQSFEVELSRTPSPTVSLKESVTSDNKLG